jgi:tetratricopeptide (TPR) repeat protein
MRLRMHLTMLGASLALAVLARGTVGAEVKRPVKLPPKDTIQYRDYNTEDLLALASALGRYHRHSEAVEAGEEALRRDLTQDQDAYIRYGMAKSYEFVRNGGPLAKEKYEEVLKLHPNYEHNAKIAFRLGELNNSIIMKGIERNGKRAVDCFEYVLRKCEDPNAQTQKVHYYTLRARMGIGNILWGQKDYEGAREHFEVIYNCDPNSAEPLPSEKFANAKDLARRKKWLKNTISSMKARIPQTLVGLCIRPNSETSIKELEKLIQDYSSDPVIVEIAEERLRQIWERIAGLEPVVDEPVEKAQEPADDSDVK